MTTRNKETMDRQFCPVCKQKVELVSLRYPDYVCITCVSSATDKQGRAVVFYNSDMFGHGCAGQYRDNGEGYPSNICYINGVECEANEAYMGGIVVTPGIRKPLSFPGT
ncbi:hypothetical protein [Pedobacter cryoconitis]|uniref:hypothetical protein n=1 Tax=Pedobacter cryoconitis TaxID=188932 RepID=UPI001C85112F|nr:hypothetical protein [Pedobacter cryoconitis]